MFQVGSAPSTITEDERSQAEEVFTGRNMFLALYS